MTFENELSNRQFSVRLKKKMPKVGVKREHSEAFGDEYEFGCFDEQCTNIHRQFGIPCSHIMTAYKYAYQQSLKQARLPSGEKDDYEQFMRNKIKPL